LLVERNQITVFLLKLFVFYKDFYGIWIYTVLIFPSLTFLHKFKVTHSFLSDVLEDAQLELLDERFILGMVN
jgi:hypothetical protein